MDADILLLRIRTLLSKSHTPVLHPGPGRRLLPPGPAADHRRQPHLPANTWPTSWARRATRSNRRPAARKGWSAFAARPFDCVLVDLVMPDINGIEVCRRINELRRTMDNPIAVLMLTGRENKEDLTRALEAGADDFVGKSSDMPVLKGRIRALLRRKFFQEENRRILEELKNKELETLRARAEKEVAEARAALVEELERTADGTAPLQGRAAPGQGGGRGGQPGQERVPGQHEPRDPHAHERHHRHDRAGPGHRARRPSSASTSSMVKHSAESLLAAHQRHPRLLQDRGRQARAGVGRFQPARQPGRHAASRWPCGPQQKGLELACHVAARRARRPGRRPAAGCGRSSSTWSATPSSSPSAARWWWTCSLEVADRRRGPSALHRPRHGHRHPRRQAAADLRGLQPGRQLDDAPVRRHRPGPDHLVAAGRR